MAKRKCKETENSNNEIDVQIKEELEKAIDNLTLFDDDLMSKVFDGNIEATELLLGIILERDDITVKRVKGQVEFKSAYSGGRNIRLDIVAVDGDGRQFDVEVQRNTKGSHVRRARFHQSMMDSRLLKKKQEFSELKDTCVIFICQHDKFGENKPIYHVDKIVRETEEKFDDGAHIIYVNGKYKGKDDFGKLAHDFNCKKADKFYFKPLADGVRHFKETEEGRDTMCESFSRLADKVAAQVSARVTEQVSEQTKVDIVRSLMKNMQWTLDQALTASGIEGKERAIIAKLLQKNL